MADITPWAALAERLPRLVEDQFSAYRRLAHAHTGPDDGPRELVAWENARKAALAHLQALIRVYDLVQSRLADTAGAVAGPDEQVSGLLTEVRRELASYPEEEGEFSE